MTTARRKSSTKSPARGADKPPTAATPASKLLERLKAEEADFVLRRLLDQHPELRAEAGQIAATLVSSSSVEDVAEDVFDRVTGVGLDALEGRAGAHSWGYVEPSQAANELLEESIEDLVEDMKRKAELGLAPAAEAMCAGIVCGLYQARRTESDGALGWNPDFPVERGGYAVEELIRACPRTARQATLERLVELLIREAPEWGDMFRRIAKQGIKD